MPDVLLEALQSLPGDRKACYELPPRRGPGRPPKVRNKKEEAEMPDVLLEALQSMPGDPKAYYESIPEAHYERLRLRRLKRKADCRDDETIGQ